MRLWKCMCKYSTQRVQVCLHSSGNWLESMYSLHAWVQWAVYMWATRTKIVESVECTVWYMWVDWSCKLARTWWELPVERYTVLGRSSPREVQTTRQTALSAPVWWREGYNWTGSYTTTRTWTHIVAHTPYLYMIITLNMSTTHLHNNINKLVL